MVIVVKGRAGEGKTTIAKLIADALKERGIHPEVVDEDDSLVWAQESRLAALIDKKIDIQIVVMQRG